MSLDNPKRAIIVHHAQNCLGFRIYTLMILYSPVIVGSCMDTAIIA